MSCKICHYKNFEGHAPGCSMGLAMIKKIEEHPAEPIPETADALDVQIGGDHYKNFKIQPVEFIQKNKLDFCEGNAIKYICRHRAKGGLQDLEKAIHYITLLAENEYGEKEEDS